jgi:hypothetical protein
VAPRDPVSYARRNRGILLGIFGAFIVFGLVRDNAAAVIGGACGVGWVMWMNRGRDDGAG